MCQGTPEPGQSLVALFKARNTLVYTSLEPGVYAIELDADDTRPYEPRCAARYLIQVAQAVVLLHSQREDNPILFPANRIWEERSVLEDHVDVIGPLLLDIPSKDAEPIRDLMAQMHDRARQRAQRVKRS